MELNQTYHNHGVSFQYPAHWDLSEEIRDDAFTVTVGDEGAFWSLTILRRHPPVKNVLDQACQAFREEYSEVDEYSLEGTVGSEIAEGRTLEFVAMELINCVFLRAARTGAVTLLSMAQVTDHERELYSPVFDAINESVLPDPDDQILLA